MNIRIPYEKADAAPLIVSIDPVTGFRIEYHSLENFAQSCIDEQAFKVKPESYIYSKLPDYNCENCIAFPLVNPKKLTEVTGYKIGGVVRKFDITQEPFKEIDSKEVSFLIGKGQIAANTDKKYMSYVLGTDNIGVFANIAKAGEAVVFHKDIDRAYQIINKGAPESIFRMIVGFNEPKQNQDLFIKLDEGFGTLSANQVRQFFLERKQQLIKSIDPDTFVQHSVYEVVEALPEKNILPQGHLAKSFKMDDNSLLHIMDSGLYLIKEKRDEDGQLKQTRTFICHSAIILGEARSQNNDNWKRVIQFHDKDNTLHRLLIPYEHFMGEAQDALKIIANHGLMPPRQSYKKNVFINYIQDYPIEQRFRCVDRAGWHGHCFATPNKTYGNSEDEELLFHSDSKSPYSVSGSFEEWQELSRLIEHHSLAVLAFSCAFSGQLVTPLAIESGGFHIYGTSTDGKSTITKASCSIWGNPKHISKPWRTTDNALENEAELRNDGFLNLDELRQATAKAVLDSLYMITGGQGKARSTKAGKNKDSKQFALMYTSTGEITLEDHLRRGNIELDAGLLLRFAHLSSDAGKGYGVFECINYGSNSSDVGNRINEMASKHYGYAGIKWLEYLTSDKDAVMQRAQKLLDSFVEQHTQEKNGQANRVLRRFGLVAVAGELATLAGITGWQQGRAFEAIAKCFNTWLGSLGNGENLEETKILEHIKAFFESNGTSRFEDLTVIRQADGEVMRPRIHNRVGYYDPIDKVYLVSSVMFKKEMCIGINEASVKKALIKHGWIKSFIEGEKKLYVKKSSNTLPDGTRPRMMHFSTEAMQNLDNEI